MYKLYYSPGSCSMAPHIALRELNVPFEAVRTSIKDGDNQKPEFKKLNPSGKVPLLVDGGQTIREGAAIMVYLFSRHPSPLLPLNPVNADALQWLMWCNATLHPAYGRAFGLNKKYKDKPYYSEQMADAVANINALWAEADAVLATRAFLAGDQPTMGDILMTVISNWSNAFPVPVVFGPNVERVLKQIVARPAYQAALQAEQVVYNVLAA